MQYYNFSARVTADQLRKTPNRNQWVAPCNPHPQRGGCTLRWGHIPIILTQQNTAAIHKCSQATDFSPLNWSLSLIRLEAGEGTDLSSHAFQTDLQSAWHSRADRLDVLILVWPWCRPHMVALRSLLFQVEHDPSNRECILQPNQERDGPASRNSSGSVL